MPWYVGPETVTESNIPPTNRTALADHTRSPDDDSSRSQNAVHSNLVTSYFSTVAFIFESLRYTSLCLFTNYILLLLLSRIINQKGISTKFELLNIKWFNNKTRKCIPYPGSGRNKTPGVLISTVSLNSKRNTISNCSLPSHTYRMSQVRQRCMQWVIWNIIYMQHILYLISYAAYTKSLFADDAINQC